MTITLQDALEDHNGVVNVKALGAAGDGSTDDTSDIQDAIDECFGTSGSPHGTSAVLNKHLYFPPGNYKITSPLNLTQVRGGRISGANRLATSIRNTAGGGVFVSNGFDYGLVECLRLSSSGAAVLFDLDWDGSGSVALQANTFRDMLFESGSHGVRIGVSNFMGSENLFLNNHWTLQSVAGLDIHNYNALQNTVIGGNFQSCEVGIYVAYGSINMVAGAGFQLSGDVDILIDNSAYDTVLLHGCRSESPNFYRATNGVNASLIGISHTSLDDGYLIFNDGQTTVDACASINGNIQGSCRGAVTNSKFGRDDWVVPNSGSPRLYARDVGGGSRFIAEGWYTDAAGLRTIERGTAAPASEAHLVGDILWNTAPAAAGTLGWVCTTAGTPGTWKAFGGIAA